MLSMFSDPCTDCQLVHGRSCKCRKPWEPSNALILAAIVVVVVGFWAGVAQLARWWLA